MQRTFHKSFENVFEECKKTIQKLGMKIEYINRSKGIISASTKTSFWSWGESIDVRIKERQKGILVEVISNSKAQLIDWGKNEDNEIDILDKLEELIAR